MGAQCAQKMARKRGGLERGEEKSQSSLTFSVITMIAVTAAIAVSQRGATNAPILPLSEVNMTSGTMAKGS